MLTKTIPLSIFENIDNFPAVGTVLINCLISIPESPNSPPTFFSKRSTQIRIDAFNKKKLMKDLDVLIHSCIRPAAECATVLLMDINRGFTIELAIFNDEFIRKIHTLVRLINDRKLSPIIISEMISRAIRPFITQEDYITCRRMIYNYTRLESMTDEICTFD